MDEAKIDESSAQPQYLKLDRALGHIRDDITSDESIRFWPVGPSLLAYQLTVDGIAVLFIERADRDWKEFFES